MVTFEFWALYVARHLQFIIALSVKVLYCLSCVFRTHVGLRRGLHWFISFGCTGHIPCIRLSLLLLAPLSFSLWRRRLIHVDSGWARDKSNLPTFSCTVHGIRNKELCSFVCSNSTLSYRHATAAAWKLRRLQFRWRQSKFLHATLVLCRIILSACKPSIHSHSNRNAIFTILMCSWKL